MKEGVLTNFLDRLDWWVVASMGGREIFKVKSNVGLLFRFKYQNHFENLISFYNQNIINLLN